MKPKRILALNPWIYDFAAHDFWLKPYGFLALLTHLKEKQIQIYYVDCLNKTISRDRYGRGKYYSEPVEKPTVLSAVKRQYKRYGKPIPEVESQIPSQDFDLILISSSMTYWYPGISKLVEIIKNKHQNTPILLGGTYANLCPEHAKKNFPQTHIFTNHEMEVFFKYLNLDYNKNELLSTLPDYQSFYNEPPYAVLRTSWGCPFKCTYCAIKNIFPDFFTVPAQRISDFIIQYHKIGIQNFVFYDDALLFNKKNIKTILHKIKQLNLPVNFHTPNALHMKYTDKEIAHLLKETGFINPHFGIETLNPDLQKQFGNKVNMEETLRGIQNLKNAGFQNGEFSAYLLFGYPGQNFKELKNDIDFLHSKGLKISLAEYSITPGTELFTKHQQQYSEPLLQNNSIFSFSSPEKHQQLYDLKNYTRRLNQHF